MNIQPIHYRHWSKAYRCTAGAAELIVITDIGPRILSLRWHGGTNLLYEDGAGFGVGEWRLYGGHRFTVAPEGGETYAPDNTACTVEMRADELRVAARSGANGTRRLLIISAASDGAGFDLRHVIENHGPQSWRGALWAITCVPPSRVVAPGAASEVRFWPGTNRREWNLAPGDVAPVSRGTRGKIGWHSEAAWLASLQPEATLVIHNPHPAAPSNCVDDGCNVEIFTCPDYLEIETLGGEVVLAPGGQASHLERWRLLEPGFGSQDWPAIAALAGCASRPPVVHAA